MYVSAAGVYLLFVIVNVSAAGHMLAAQQMSMWGNGESAMFFFFFLKFWFS